MNLQKRLRGELTAEYERRKRRNPSYSLRAFARDLGVQVSGLSDILLGKRALSARMATKLRSIVSLSDGELAQLKSQEKALRAERRESYVKLSPADFDIISNWHYAATLLMCELSHFNGTEKELSAAFGIAPGAAAELVQKLISLRLLSRTSGTLKAETRAITFGSGKANAAIQASHRDHLHVAEKALTALSAEERDFSFISIATHPDRLTEARSRILKFRRSLTSFLEKAPEKTTIFRFGAQLFPLIPEMK